MRKAFALLLFLSACGSKTDQPGGGGGQPSPAGLEPSLPAAPGAEQLQAKARTALASVLLNPVDARYFNVRAGAPGGVCGEVDSWQGDGRFGGPRPFVVTPEGVAVVSPTTRVVFGNPADMFPDFYIRWCATPEELAKLGPGIREEEPPEDPAANMAAAPDMDLSPPIAVPKLPIAPPPVPQTGGKAARSEQPPEPNATDKDSFFNAVIRKKEASPEP